MDHKSRTYTSKEITVYWKPKECIHAGTCFRELRKVFDPARRPWIDLSQASVNEIVDIVDRCPTDALTFKYNDEDEKDNEPSISIIGETQSNENVNMNIMRNGPILAEGEFTIVHEDGSEQQIKSITSLCRCGLSRKMPFCDGTHTKKGFFPDNF